MTPVSFEDSAIDSSRRSSGVLTGQLCDRQQRNTFVDRGQSGPGAAICAWALPQIGDRAALLNDHIG
jgi:hypothetical protein